MRRGVKVVSWGIALLGLWEFADVAAVFVPGFGHIRAFVWNHIAVGLILILAGVRAATARDVRTARIMDWIAVAAGAWLVAASFILGSTTASPGLWNDVVVGLLAAILAVGSVWLLRRG